MSIPQVKVFPRDAYAVPSLARFFYLCAQNSGDIGNLLPGGPAATKFSGLSDAICWQTPGFATTGGSPTQRAEIPGSVASLGSLATHSIVLTARLKKTAVALPAAEQQLYASYQPGSQHGGLAITLQPNGGVRIYVSAADSTVASITTAANVLTNGSAAPERTITFILPREGLNAAIGVDGVEAVTASMATLAGKDLSATRTARLGVALNGTAADLCGIASFAIYAVPQPGANLSRPHIHEWAHRNPHLPIPDWIFGL